MTRKARFYTVWITDFVWQIEKIATVVIAIIGTIALLKGEMLFSDLELLRIQKIRPESVSLEQQIKLDMEHMEVPEDLLKPEVKESMSITEVIVDKEFEDNVWILAQAMHAEEGVFFKFYDTNPQKVEKVHKLAGSVILHRMEVQYLGATTIEEVIFSKGQYAKQTQERVRKGQDIPEVVYDWAEELLTEGAIGPRGLIYQAEFEQGDSYDCIGNQYFGVESKYN